MSFPILLKITTLQKRNPFKNKAIKAMSFCNSVNMIQSGKSLTKNINSIVVRVSIFNYFNDS